MAKTNLTAQQVRDALDYDPGTGVLTWRHRLNSIGRAVRSIGKQAGHSDKNGRGRIMVNIMGSLYYGHRIAWLHYYGKWPAGSIDHIDGDPTNNRITNLRDVPQAINMQNRRVPQRNTTTGILGVHRHPNTTKYRARVGVNGKEVHLGLFVTAEEAQAAYLEAKRRLHEGCTL